VNNDFLEELAARLKDAAKKPNILSYKTNSPVHEEFHKSLKVGRILQGGNRSGKSTAGIVESVWRATGKHPFQRVPEPPTKGRIVTVDNDNGIEHIVKPLLSQWIPPSELVNGSWEDSFIPRKKLMKFRNGSTIDLKTHQQEVEAFAGVPLHYVHFDEECPQAIFNECRLRLIDYNGCWYMTMTPVEGQDWIFDRFIVTKAKNVQLFEVDISDNPHLSKEALALLEEDLTDDEKAVRQKGIFVPRGGLILREFDPNRHITTPRSPLPRNWSYYMSVDHGFNNPTAILWHGVSPSGKVVTFKEHYMRRMIIKDHAKRIHEINNELGIIPTISMCDPSMSQRTAESGSSPLLLYRENGIPLVPAKKDVDGRINKMNEYFKYDMWTITQDCPNLVKEIRGYSFKIYNSAKIADRNNVMETPQKKNDHAVDSAGYFFTFMPYLGPEQKGMVKKRSLTETHMEDFPWQVDSELMYGLDEGNDEFAFGEIR
jgi:phage terminase large subunit-like protein